MVAAVLALRADPTSGIFKAPSPHALKPRCLCPNPLTYPTLSNAALLPRKLILLPELRNHELALETDDLPELIHVTQ